MPARMQRLELHPVTPQQRLLRQAAELMRGGAVVVYPTDDATYVATVTVQAVDPEKGSYAQDAQTILEGFQVLAAG